MKFMRSKEAVLNQLLSGEIQFATVSGVWSTKAELIRKIDETVPEISVITTKSFQVSPNPGNREPIIGEKFVGSYVNAVGLKNPGMNIAHEELSRLKKSYQMRALLNVSISGNSPEDFIALVHKFEDLADILELNFSCPHAKPGYGASIGMDPGLVSEYMIAIRPETDALLFPKLTPNVDKIGIIAEKAVMAGADGIVAVNTVGPEAYREPVSNQLLLYNPNGHQGGRSGEHIFNEAVSHISKIRQIVGRDIPIIGMGGVSRGSQVRDMVQAGANVVGVGSAIARVDCSNRSDYFNALKLDCARHENSADKFLSEKPLAKYEKYTICNLDRLSDTLITFDLQGPAMNFHSSQYVFLWIPGVGEKPFGLIRSQPLTFIVRKRRQIPGTSEGEFTHALFRMDQGDNIYVRGPYGRQAPATNKKDVIIVSGGTGLAIVPRLSEELRSMGKTVHIFHGVTSNCEIAFRDLLMNRSDTCSIVCDKGKPGRVLDHLKKKLKEIDPKRVALFTIGPDILMKKAMQAAENAGIDSCECYASLETNHMCGIGMCGECQCGGVLSCKDGTFFNWEFLKKHYFDN